MRRVAKQTPLMQPIVAKGFVENDGATQREGKS